jgi:hypothetical protein
MNDSDLLDEFVALFESLEEMVYPDAIVPAGRQTTNVAATQALYALLPAKFPSLYEMLTLSYRWQSSSIRDDGYRLLANPIGKDLSGLTGEIFRDKGLSDELLPNGFIQFAFGPPVDYDPICFQTNCKTADDYPVVRVDHEEILCNFRIKVTEKIAPSFREFVMSQIAAFDK